MLLAPPLRILLARFLQNQPHDPIIRYTRGLSPRRRICLHLILLHVGRLMVSILSLAFQVSTLCKDRMHVFLAEELRRASSDFGESLITVDVFTAATMRTFRRMDELALASCACGSVGEPSCGCEQAGFSSQIVGSTAVVAVVDHHRVFVANCGDSRAVLSRGGRAAPLSSDHKVMAS